MTIWAIYNAPSGSPAQFVVQAWHATPGAQASSGPPVFAATLDQAREVVPHGLKRSDPIASPGEASRLIETWEPPE